MGSAGNGGDQTLLLSSTVDSPTLEPEPKPKTAEERQYKYSVQLERMLSNTDLPFLQRIVAATWIEFRLLFPLAAPATAVYLINCLMSTFTQIFSGHLGNLELAAASLGNNGIQTFCYGLMGIWAGMFGGTLMQTVILIWVTYRTDWNKEVELALRRLNKWDEQKEPLLKG